MKIKTKLLLIPFLIMPSICLAHDGGAILLLIPFVWLAVPMISALLTKKGRYLFTLLILTAIWAVHAFFSVIFFGFFYSVHLSDTGRLMYWGISASMLPLAMVVYRLDTFTRTKKVRIRPLHVAFALGMAIGAYLLVFVVPLPVSQYSWNEEPKTWNDPFHKRLRVAKYVTTMGRLIGKPSGAATELLGEPLLPTIGLHAIDDQVTGRWERYDASTMVDHERLKKEFENKQRVPLALIYRLGVEKYSSQLEPDFAPAEPYSKVEWLEITLNDKGVISGVSIRAGKFRTSELSVHLLQ